MCCQGRVAQWGEKEHDVRATELERQWTAKMVRIAEMIALLDEGQGMSTLPGASMDSVRILCPGESRADALIIVKASVGSAQWVGFVGGLDIQTALLTWRKKELSVGLTYREDKPWEGEGV